MSVDEVKQTFDADSTDKTKLSKVYKPGKAVLFFPKEDIDKNMQLYLALIEKAKLLDKNVDCFAVFDTGTGLVGFQYRYHDYGKEDDGRASSWQYYQRLLEAMTTKYGAPSENGVPPEVLGKNIAKNTHYDVIWRDSTSGDEIKLMVTYQSTHVILAEYLNVYNTVLTYSKSDWVLLRRNAPKDSDL
jgi:hypothetical protein